MTSSEGEGRKFTKEDLVRMAGEIESELGIGLGKELEPERTAKPATDERTWVELSSESQPSLHSESVFERLARQTLAQSEQNKIPVEALDSELAQPLEGDIALNGMPPYPALPKFKQNPVMMKQEDTNGALTHAFKNARAAYFGALAEGKRDARLAHEYRIARGNLLRELTYNSHRPEESDQSAFAAWRVWQQELEAVLIKQEDAYEAELLARTEVAPQESSIEPLLHDGEAFFTGLRGFVQGGEKTIQQITEARRAYFLARERGVRGEHVGSLDALRDAYHALRVTIGQELTAAEFGPGGRMGAWLQRYWNIDAAVIRHLHDASLSPEKQSRVPKTKERAKKMKRGFIPAWVRNTVATLGIFTLGVEEMPKEPQYAQTQTVTPPRVSPNTEGSRETRAPEAVGRSYAVEITNQGAQEAFMRLLSGAPREARTAFIEEFKRQHHIEGEVPLFKLAFLISRDSGFMNAESAAASREQERGALLSTSDLETLRHLKDPAIEGSFTMLADGSVLFNPRYGASQVLYDGVLKEFQPYRPGR